MAGLGEAGNPEHGLKRLKYFLGPGMARQGKAGSGKARVMGTTLKGPIFSHGKGRLGKAWLGGARQGGMSKPVKGSNISQGMGGHGSAGFGRVRQGRAWQGGMSKPVKGSNFLTER